MSFRIYKSEKNSLLRIRGCGPALVSARQRKARISTGPRTARRAVRQARLKTKPECPRRFPSQIRIYLRPFRSQGAGHQEDQAGAREAECRERVLSLYV